MYNSVTKPLTTSERLEMFAWCKQVLGTWQNGECEGITYGWSHRINRISNYHVNTFSFPRACDKFMFDIRFGHYEIYDSLNDYYNKVERAKFSPKQPRWTI